MLLRFGTSNHRSIRDYQELFFTASPLKDQESGLLALTSEPVTKAKHRGLPVLAIYGANAAGKSAVIDALDTYVTGIVWSHDRAGSDKGTAYDPFLLDKTSRDKPSRYDGDFVLGGARYHYGFTIDSEVVISEWMYSYPINAARETRTILFHRDSSNTEHFYFGKSLKGDNKRISKLVRKNSLFLSAAAQNSHPQLLPIYDFFYKKVSRRLDTDQPAAILGEQLYAYFANCPERYDQVVSFLRAADVGIAKVDFSKVPLTEQKIKILEDIEQLIAKHIANAELKDLHRGEETKVEILHVGEDLMQFPISLDNESSGTCALLQLLGPVFSKLYDGGVLIVDELNVALHPLVSRELIRLFSCPTSNPGKAQLIFSTHDTSILTAGLLRRDQIWFAEKDQFGATCIYPLSSINVRATDNLEKGYIAGRFGAIPFLGANFSAKHKIFNAHELERELQKSGLDKQIDDALRVIGNISDIPLGNFK